MEDYRKTKKIVLAEGKGVIAEILPQFLKPMGFEVFVAHDGTSALRTIRIELPKLIIIDCDLAGLDVFSLCKILKGDFLTSYIPIIVLIDQKQIRKKLLVIKEGIDDYILKPPDPIDLQVRLEMALRRTDHNVHANALTRLPGNKAIELAARTRLTSEEAFSFMYIDIDHFKSFNDTYGYLRGDGVIMQTAKILTDSVKRLGNENDFVGHIGGDDFVIITTPLKERMLAKEIIKEFDRLIPLHYHEHDRLLGYLLVKDRQGNDFRDPLMSVSISIVNNKLRKITSLIELTEITSEIKKHLKTIPGSKFLANRRSVNKEKTHRKEQVSEGISHIQKEGTLPLGQILLKAKLIDEEQLTEALFEHWASRELFGQTLIKMKLVKKEDLEPLLTKYS